MVQSELLTMQTGLSPQRGFVIFVLASQARSRDFELRPVQIFFELFQTYETRRFHPFRRLSILCRFL